MERVLRPTPLYLSSMNLHSFRHIFWLMCASICSTLVWGQTPQGSLPKEITQWEKAQWLARPLDISNPSILRGIPTPPPGNNLRTAAEWEEIEVLTITWEMYRGQPTFPCILKQIASAATQECRVVVFSENVSQTTSYLSSNNCGGAVLMDSVDVVDAAYNSIWIRDYGANTVYTEYNDGRVLVDWLYNRPRPDDDAIPDALAEHMGLDLYSAIEGSDALMATGGNWMSDGHGTGFSSELILDENSGGNSWWTVYPDHSESEIDGIMSDYHGIDTYVKMDNLPYDGIHHIDMHMKLLDESTLLVSEYPAGVADGPQIEANLQYVLSNFTTKWGTPFNVIRIPSPPEYGDGYPNQGGDYLTYSNATFVNNTILLPTYYQQYDTTAIRLWEEAMPGYNVVGIDCDSQGEDLIRLSGAIHCITHSVGVADPLMISHLPLSDTEDVDNDRAVRADISHRSGIATATMSWSIGPDGPWTEVPMAEVDANDLFATYEASIPALPVGTKVHYFVSAEANSGKSGSRPMPAPEGWWSYKVVGASLGLDEANATSPWRALYPNPAKAMTCLELNMPKPTACQVTLHNSLGQQVRMLHEGVLPQGTQRLFLDASSLASGPYLVTLTTVHGTRWTERLMVQE